MAKKILYICPSSGLGGAETFIKTTFLFHHQDTMGPVYLLFRKGPLYEWLIENHARVHILESPPRLSNPIDLWKTHRSISKIIAQEKIDLVHSTMAYGALFSSLAAAFQQKPHLWFQHGPASGWMDQLAALLPHQCLLVNSNYTLQKQLQLETPFRFFNKNIQKIKLDLGVPSVDISSNDTKKLRSELLALVQKSEPCLVLGMACRLQKWKGVDLIIDAARLLLPQFKNFHIFIWGEKFDSDQYVTDLKRNAENLPVTFMGASQDVPLALSACDMTVNCSIQPEPFGLTLIESLSVGTPVIAAYEGGPQEFIVPNNNGLLFEPRSALDLADKIKNLLLEPRLLETLKMNAKSSFLSRFTGERMIHQLEQIYTDLM